MKEDKLLACILTGDMDTLFLEADDRFQVLQSMYNSSCTGMRLGVIPQAEHEEFLLGLKISCIKLLYKPLTNN